MKPNIRILENRRMTAQDFSRLGTYIENEFGIKMPGSKKMMLQARLQKRLRELGHATFREYINYIFSRAGKDEILRMVDEVTTNKTDFFREPEQFDFLYQYVLPELREKKKGKAKFISVWSAGCSSGEEPYSIAMTLAEFVEKNKDFDFEILATDLSQKVLEEARVAIYQEEQIEAIPMKLRKKYLLKSKTKQDKIVRIVPAIRQKVKFFQHNLMANTIFTNRSFDIIFCRNVIIYFDQERQKELFQRFYHHLNSGGFLFLGHSESMINFGLPFEMVKPKIYRKS
ncbi:MAG: protein-glutamate O-methyltransferase [Calditrichaeota bacterium]|nr:protein-glutamate O-methyltransferase [Calditrichota bacterium]